MSKGQNYSRNIKIKKMADKNQKGYIEEQEEDIPDITNQNDTEDSINTDEDPTDNSDEDPTDNSDDNPSDDLPDEGDNN